MQKTIKSLSIIALTLAGTLQGMQQAVHTQQIRVTPKQIALLAGTALVGFVTYKYFQNTRQQQRLAKLLKDQEAQREQQRQEQKQQEEIKRQREQEKQTIIDLCSSYWRHDSNFEKAQGLLTRENCNLINDEGFSLLWLALSNKNNKLANYLIDLGADVKPAQEENVPLRYTPLQTAINNATSDADIALVNKLLEHGAIADYTALTCALNNQLPVSVELTQILVNAGAPLPEKAEDIDYWLDGPETDKQKKMEILGFKLVNSNQNTPEQPETADTTQADTNSETAPIEASAQTQDTKENQT
jgi:ankyrin repeat protein